MESKVLPTMSEFNSMEKNDFMQVVHLLFETAPPLANSLFNHRPYESFSELITKTEHIIPTLSHQDRHMVINAHPRIGAAKTHLSSLSLAEQGYEKKEITNNSLEQNEEESVNSQLKRLNDLYESKYGFKFIVFVNGRSRKDIIPVLEQRIQTGTAESEMELGFKEMINIAKDRLKKLTSIKSNA